MNLIERTFDQDFPYVFGQKLTEYVGEYGKAHILYFECRYPHDRPLFKITASDKDLRRLFSVVKPNLSSNSVFKYVGVIARYDPQTGRKFYQLALICVTHETNPDFIEVNINDLAQRLDSAWSDISKNNDSGFIGSVQVNEINETVLKKLFIETKNVLPSQKQWPTDKAYDDYVRYFKNTLVMRISLHVPYTRTQVLTEKDFDLFHETLNRALANTGKSELSGELHNHRHENNAGCFDVVLFLNGDEVAPRQDSFMEVMKLIEDAWHVVTKHRFVTTHFVYMTSKEQEALTTLLKRHVLNPLRRVPF